MRDDLDAPQGLRRKPYGAVEKIIAIACTACIIFPMMQIYQGTGLLPATMCCDGSSDKVELCGKMDSSQIEMEINVRL